MYNYTYTYYTRAPKFARVECIRDGTHNCIGSRIGRRNLAQARECGQITANTYFSCHAKQYTVRHTHDRISFAKYNFLASRDLAVPVNKISLSTRQRERNNVQVYTQKFANSAGLPRAYSRARARSRCRSDLCMINIMMISARPCYEMSMLSHARIS